MLIGVLIVLSLILVPDARPYVLLSIPLAALFAAEVLGLALVAACLNVLFRDVEHVLAAALLPWFFVTPILWSTSTLGDRAERHHALLTLLHWGNPVAPPIFAVRDAIWSGHAPNVLGRRLSRRRGDRRARARCDRLQVGRRPDRGRAVSTIRPS